MSANYGNKDKLAREMTANQTILEKALIQALDTYETDNGENVPEHSNEVPETQEQGYEENSIGYEEQVEEIEDASDQAVELLEKLIEVKTELVENEPNEEDFYGEDGTPLRDLYQCKEPMNNGTECNEEFGTCCQFSRHFYEEHAFETQMQYNCHVCNQEIKDMFHPCFCGKIYATKRVLQEHQRHVHSNRNGFQCEVCTKIFTQKGNLKTHMMLHTGLKPFKCEYCPKAFPQKFGLIQHTRIHTDTRPFICVICTKRFRQIMQLNQHMRIHTNIKPYTCGHCNKSFKQSSHLNRHLTTHTRDSNTLTLVRNQAKKVVMQNLCFNDNLTRSQMDKKQLIERLASRDIEYVLVECDVNDIGMTEDEEEQEEENILFGEDEITGGEGESMELLGME